MVGGEGRRPRAHRGIGSNAARQRPAGHRDGYLTAGEFLEDAGIGVDAIRGEEGAVLDRLRPRAHRTTDAPPAVAVPRPPHPLRILPLHTCLQLAPPARPSPRP